MNYYFSNAQCIVPPQSVMTKSKMINLLKFKKNIFVKVLENTSSSNHGQQMKENTARSITRTFSNSEIEKIENISQEEK